MDLLKTILVGAVFCFAVNAMAGSHSKAPKAMMMKGDLNVAFVNEMVGGKKTWVMVPSNVSFKKGQMVHAKIANVLNGPHGFEIPGLVKAKVVPAHSSETIMFKTKTSGNIAVKCHLHPAHVGTSFMVK